jgi:DNA-binding beta-propeller fold protein YncE
MLLEEGKYTSLTTTQVQYRSYPIATIQWLLPVPLQIPPLNLAYDAGIDEVFVVHSETNVVSVISDSPNATSLLPDKPQFPQETLYIIAIVAVAAIIAGVVLAIKRRM